MRVSLLFYKSAREKKFIKTGVVVWRLRADKVHVLSKGPRSFSKVMINRDQMVVL